ncbi:MAG: T9SS type A sorting domain-containing protein [Saprospiraceae bacterium]|nr:T9SS type A sorting domain-containing protein [Saprospiraceae bacterium]
MGKFVLSLLILSIVKLSGQPAYFYLKKDIGVRNCVQDTSVKAMQYKYLDIYQTLNNEVDGPMVEGCAALVNQKLPLADFEKDRPIFFRVNRSSNLFSSLLEANELYTLDYRFGATQKSFKNSEDCISEKCSKMVFSTRERKFGQPHDTLRRTEYTANVYQNQAILENYICHPTSKFDSIAIEDVWWEIYLNDQIPAGAVMYFDEFSGNPQIFVTKIKKLKPITFTPQNNVVDIRINDLIDTTLFGFNYMFLHAKDGTPSPVNRDDKVILLEPNPATLTEIRLNLVYEALYFQEYTSISAGKVANNDTLSHKLSINQMGGEICIEGIDLRLGDGVNFHYTAGHLNFADLTACMFFKKGSSLIVEPGAKLTYGEPGMGMLGLSDAAVHLKNGASLLFDGTLLLNGETQLGSHFILEQNSRITFGSSAAIQALGASDERIMVTGNASQFDFGKLGIEEIERFVFTDPDPLTYGSHNLVYPNPFNRYFFFIPEYNGENYYLQDMQGQLVKSGQCGLHAVEFPDLTPGLYFIKVGNHYEKLVYSP